MLLRSFSYSTSLILPCECWSSIVRCDIIKIGSHHSISSTNWRYSLNVVNKSASQRILGGISWQVLHFITTIMRVYGILNRISFPMLLPNWTLPKRNRKSSVFTLPNRKSSTWVQTSQVIIWIFTCTSIPRVLEARVIIQSHDRMPIALGSSHQQHPAVHRIHIYRMLNANVGSVAHSDSSQSPYQPAVPVSFRRTMSVYINK